MTESMSRTKAPVEPDQEDVRTQWVGADSILFATAHRPWPAPMAPWIMTQRWNDLLFLHYSLDPELVRARVPDVLTLDTYRQRAWVSVTPFWINHLRPPGVPSLPWFSSFNEINVRTYVTYGGKPGVYFFSLDASNLSAVWGARVFYRLPYWQASMKVTGKGGAKIEYRSKRQHGPKPAELECYLRTDRTPSLPGASGFAGAFPHRALLPLHRHPQTALSRRHSSSAVGVCRIAEVDVRKNTMAQTAGLQLAPETGSARTLRGN